LDTTTVPCIIGWIEQMYSNVPAFWKVNEYVASVSIPGEWNVVPSLETTVWGSSSLLVQVTVLPAEIVRLAGANAKLLMLTAFEPCGASDAAGAAAEPEPPGIGMGMEPDVVAPTIPGVPSALKVIEAGPAAGVLDEEHPTTSRSATAVMAAAVAKMVVRGRRSGAVLQGKANTSVFGDDSPRDK
jgi:hypothetical protein